MQVASLSHTAQRCFPRPLRRIAAVSAVSLALGISASDALSQNLTIGAPIGGQNCYPFCNPSSTNIWRYQQVYLSSLFGLNPIDISGLYFFNSLLNPFTQYSGHTYTLSLSWSGITPTTFSSNPAANVGTNNRRVWSGALTGAPSSLLYFGFSSPFRYNPQVSNLLLDISITGSGTGNGIAFDQDDTFFRTQCNGAQVGRSYGTDTFVSSDCAFLVTGFDAVATPEPATMLLLVSGLAGVGGVAMRRRRTKTE